MTVTKVVGTLVSLAGLLVAHQLSLAPGQFSFEPFGEFYRVVAEGFTSEGPPGHPVLPVRFLTYILPPGTKAESVDIKTSEYKFVGKYYICPAQPSVPLDSTPPWVPPDSAIYNSKSPYPAAPVEIVNRGFFDGASVVTVAVRPVRYIPVNREVFALSWIEFDFFLSEAAPPTRAMVRDIHAQETHDLALRAVIENDEDIPAYYQSPMLISEQAPGANARAPYPSPTQYTIITNDLLASSFQPFADWLTNKGVPASVVRMSQFLPYFSGVDSAEKLRNYLKYGYQQCGAIWVLLGGDAGVVPFRYGWRINDDTARPNASGNIIPSDLYFSDMNGNWDVDGDQRWGEPHDGVDVYPELYVGRLTVRQSEKVQNWVNKLLYYEMNGSNDLSQFNRATWIYDGEAGLTPYSQTFEQFPLYYTHSYYNSVTAPTARNAFGRAASPSSAAGIYNVNCHGDPRNFASKSTGGWWKVWADSSPDGENEQNAWLRRCDLPGRHYIVYDIGCYTAAFDPFIPHPPGHEYYPSDTLLADAYTDFYPTTLGVAHLGNTRWGWPTASRELQHCFWQLFFSSGNASLGVAEGLSKVDYPDYYLRHAHSLFGSPENEPWIMSPASMYVRAPSSIPQGVPVQFQVKCSTAGGAGISRVRVCLYKPNDVYQLRLTNSSGIANFTVCAGSPGTLLVTCSYRRAGTGSFQQYLPRQRTCQVIPAKGEGPQSEESGLPRELGFTALNPNPALGNLTVQYGVPVKGRVKLLLYDTQGRSRSVITDEDVNPGYYRQVISRDAWPFSAGVYFLALTQNGSQVTRKVAVAK
ncbi:MAG: C25 family cysteine peptidase [candidate division WOR-3 bacterium]